MSTSSVESAALDALRSSYTAYQTEDTTSSSSLGTEQFLTLLVAQLSNQNPLDPVDSDQWTSQLAQYSELEQMVNLNDKMDVVVGQMSATDTTDVSDYIGMQVTAEANTMTLSSGVASSGVYELSSAAEVSVVITDSDGDVVNTLDQGQQEAGTYSITWDGSDSSGSTVDDGTYTYTVMANTGSGYEALSSTISGTVQAVAWKDGTEYLVVNGTLLDPDSVTLMSDPDVETDQTTPSSILEYLGTTVTTSTPLIQVENNQVTGGDLTFTLDSAEAAEITIYNASGQSVSTISLPADDTQAGENQVAWDGILSTGSAAQDGLYAYSVTTDSGTAETPVEGEVTGIVSVNGTQYLALSDSGRRVALGTVTSVQ